MNNKILLVKNIKVDRQYTKVLSYEEKDMINLCQQNLVAQAGDYSFIRTNRNILTNFTYEQCLKANYIAFQNTDYSGKWFFAWIDDVIYRGNSNTEISYTIDAWSTWYEKIKVKPCFINRQHVNNDTIGSNTIPENLDIGEVISEQTTEDEIYGNEYGYYIAVASNWRIKDNSTDTDSEKGTQNAGISVYNNTIFGTEIFIFNIVSLESFSDLALFLLRTNSDGHISDVENIFILPRMAVSVANLLLHQAKVGEHTFNFYTINYNMTAQTFDTTINKRHSFSDFTPKNNKCYVYPYNYLYVTNNNGSNNIFRYEDFSTDNCVFENQFSIAVGGSGRLVPKNYLKKGYDDDNAITLGKYPTCGWSSDAYINWLTSNAVNIISSPAMTVGNLLTGGGINPATITSIASNIANTIGSFYQASLLPNTSSGQASGDIIWVANRNKFIFREMRAKTEYLKIIDDYFTRFGYAIKKIDVPRLKGRKYWNYVEIGSSEEIGYGEVPSKFMTTINEACRRGVTIWHSHSVLGDYSLNNVII